MLLHERLVNVIEISLFMRHTVISLKRGQDVSDIPQLQSTV